jgi:hypothetical protein
MSPTNQIVVTTGYCIGCWQPNNTVYIKQGCAGAAAARFVLRQDAMKAKDIFVHLTTTFLTTLTIHAHAITNQDDKAGAVRITL